MQGWRSGGGRPPRAPLIPSHPIPSLRPPPNGSKRSDPDGVTGGGGGGKEIHSGFRIRPGCKIPIKQKKNPKQIEIKNNRDLKSWLFFFAVLFSFFPHQSRRDEGRSNVCLSIWDKRRCPRFYPPPPLLSFPSPPQPGSSSPRVPLIIPIRSGGN